VALGVCLVAVGASADWLATGRFEYTDRLYDATGFTGTTPAPVREADVEIYDLQSSAVLALGATDASGDFAIAVVDGETRDIGVRVLASTDETPSLHFEVVDNKSGNAVYTYHDPVADESGHAPDDDVGFGTMTMPASIGSVATTDWSSQIFNLFDMGLLMAEWVETFDGTRPTIQVLFVFNPTTGRASSSYSNGTNRLYVADDDGYDDPNVLHELGHFVEDEYGATRNPGGVHTIGDDDQDPRVAWSEGFASFFSAAALELEGRPRPDLYSDRDSFGVSGGFAFTVEANVVGGSTSEVAVAGALWDMVDSAGTADAVPGIDDDGLSSSETGIWQVIEALRIASPEATQLEDFWDTWGGLALPAGPDLELVFAAHSVDFVVDAQEPNDSPATATALTVGGGYLENTFYDSGAVAGGDEDWFRFAAIAGTDYRIEIAGTADTLFGRPDPEIVLFDSDRELLVASDDPRDLLLNDASSDSAQDMGETVPEILFRAATSGDHWVYVRHRSAPLNLGGRYGTYRIRILAEAPLAPVIDEVAAQSMRTGETYPMLVHGQNFVHGATLAFSDPGIVVDRLDWVATTTLYAEVSVDPGVAPGSFSATLTNPGGAGDGLVDAIEVAASAQPPVVISEVFPDTDQVEIHNRGQTTADLGGWQIQGYRAGVGATGQIFTFPAFSLGPDARVVVHDGFGANTATELYDLTAGYNWSWVADVGGAVSLIDAAGRNVDYLRFVDSYVDDHADPDGSGGAWMQPELMAPPAGFSMARSEVDARYRTARGLAVASPSLPSGASGRENAVDAWEDNDDPRLAIPLSRSGILAGLAIHARPGGQDEDWFGVLLTAGQEVLIEADFVHAQGDLELEIYAPGDEPAAGDAPIVSATSATDDELASITNALTTLHGGGLYRIRIYGSGGATNDYALGRSVLEVCGNGELTAGEACDDGNLLPGDCCSATCTIETAGTVCRASLDLCDLEEQCDGVAPVCPADLKSVAICRPIAGDCDVAEICDGLSDACPADQLLPAATSCRLAAGECDLEELCDGAVAACPADLKSVAECRPASDVCDLSESCDGASDDCPADLLVPDTSVCRAAVGGCDVEELCTGASTACPADVDLDGQTCSDGDLCNGEELCLGSVCDVGVSLDCDDLDACTADSCDGVLGCRNEPIPGCTAVPIGGAFLRLALVLGLLAGGVLAIERRS